MSVYNDNHIMTNNLFENEKKKDRIKKKNKFLLNKWKTFMKILFLCRKVEYYFWIYFLFIFVFDRSLFYNFFFFFYLNSFIIIILKKRKIYKRNVCNLVQCVKYCNKLFCNCTVIRALKYIELSSNYPR